VVVEPLTVKGSEVSHSAAGMDGMSAPATAAYARGADVPTTHMSATHVSATGKRASRSQGKQEYRSKADSH
jgi:hypothetical protein